jgi:DNA-binding FadR family transcriptional regulator
MNAEVKHILARVGQWPEDDQDELAQLALEIETRRHGAYHATPEELRAIDEAIAAVAHGEIAADEDAEALFAKHTAVISSERNSL